MNAVHDLLQQTGEDADAFIAALLAQMTLEERLGQLCLYTAEADPAADAFNPTFDSTTHGDRPAQIRRGEVGGMFNTTSGQQARTLQEIAVEQTRLGIPLIFAADVIHGYRTIFPVPLAEMASWDPELAQRTARAAATEASAAGLDWTFAPGMDVARDARWGRTVESSGEDALLASRFAAARVRGFQSEDLRQPTAMMATAKHFAAYGAAEAGLDYTAADVSWRSLREHYLPPFQAAVNAGVGAIMTAFNDVDGVPCTANETLLRTVLREEWGFGGIVVSDYTSDYEMIAHGYAADDRDAARLSLNAGLDTILQSGLFVRFGVGLVKSGEVDVATIDRAVERMLRAKWDLGLFHDPYLRLAEALSSPIAPQARPLAREAATRSVVLLKNAQDTLPLAATTRIALIGPLADDPAHLNGCWSVFGDTAESVTIRRGLEKQFGKASVCFERGCAIDKTLKGGCAKALELAADADVVVLALGESERWSGEARSRSEIGVPAPQLELARAIRACGKPVVTLLTTGRPLPLEELSELSDALLVTWFLGSEAGHAVADVLSGQQAPRARLPMSFPRRAGQVPLYYNRKASGRPWLNDGNAFSAAYVDTPPSALYPFGDGLTYTRFRFGPVHVSAGTMSEGEEILVSADVTNVGQRPGETLAQLYIRDVAASVVRPVRELKDFQWIALNAGETRTVEFTLTMAQLAFWKRDMQFGVEPGAFEVWVADNAQNGQSSPITFVSRT
jgi:beta-glucosidase